MILPISSLTISSSPISIRGWAETVRTQKSVIFLVVRDGVGESRRIQVVVPRSICDSIAVESFLEISGIVKELPKGAVTSRGFEMQAVSVKILGQSDPIFSSLCPKDAGPGTKLSERHIFIRDQAFAKKTALRSYLVRALRDFFFDTECTEVFPPSFVGTQCEGGATLFKVEYPGLKKSEDATVSSSSLPGGEEDDTEIGKSGSAYLTQSSQFYLEYALPALGDTFCIAPSFRKESSHTRRHLCEFLHAECEWTGVLTLEEHIEKLRALVKGTVERFLRYGEVLLKELGLHDRVKELLEKCDHMMVMTHREAIDYCRSHEIYKDPETKTHFDYSDDIPEAQERRVIDELDQIVFLTRFPTVQKSFYMQEAEDDPTYAYGVDVEFPGVGECIGSGMRVHDVEVLRRRLAEQGLDEKEYREYIDLRRFGPGRTSGMGLGVDRFLTWLLGAYSIREVVTFPRYPGRVFP